MTVRLDNWMTNFDNKLGFIDLIKWNVLIQWKLVLYGSNCDCVIEYQMTVCLDRTFNEMPLFHSWHSFFSVEIIRNSILGTPKFDAIPKQKKAIHNGKKGRRQGFASLFNQIKEAFSRQLNWYRCLAMSVSQTIPSLKMYD